MLEVASRLFVYVHVSLYVGTLHNVSCSVMKWWMASRSIVLTSDSKGEDRKSNE